MHAIRNVHFPKFESHIKPVINMGIAEKEI